MSKMILVNSVGWEFQKTLKTFFGCRTAAMLIRFLFKKKNKKNNVV